MPKVLAFEEDGYEVEVVVDESAPEFGATDASVGDFVEGVTVVAKRSLSDAVGIIGHLARAFTKALAEAEPKPAEVELAFELEAGGEAGNFVVSKLSGKANFSVKMVWKFESAAE